MEDSAQAQLADLLTYQVHKKKIKVPKVVVPQPPPKVILDAHTLFFDGAYRRRIKKAGGGFALPNPMGEIELEEIVVQ